ncbi:MAG TPA: sulfotransferase [Bacteroidia bacterium]|nr:sulfotransferase [Bacteroidia bacterium]
MRNNIFFLVGAQRAGTTYLYNIFDEHPEVIMAKPVKPEPKFFILENEFQKGEEYYFNKFFQNDNKKKIYGEKSTSYMESAEAASRIKQMFPQAKILISLRNPVFRAVSNYYFSLRNNIETRSIREVFIEKKPEPKHNFSISVSPYNYLGRGEYLKYIQLFCDVFGKSNTKILVLKKIAGNIAAIQHIYQFVGADADFIPACLNNVVNSNDIVYNVDEEVVEYLKKYYRPHIESLEVYLNEDLSDWKK